MLDIISNQENTNQNHNMILFSTPKRAIKNHTQKITNAREDVEKLELSNIAGGNENGATSVGVPQ